MYRRTLYTSSKDEDPSALVIPAVADNLQPLVQLRTQSGFPEICQQIGMGARQLQIILQLN